MILKHLTSTFQFYCRLLKDLITHDDRITTLPDDILYSIISLLTVRDAVNASTLSRRWRDLCVSMPNLNFDLHTVFGAPFVDERGSHYCPRYRCEFVKILDQFLEGYLGSKISYFRISLCLGRECSRSIDQWVSSAVRLGVEKLELYLLCDKNIFKEGTCNNLYTLSLQLISEASKLKHLSLSACILKPDLTNRFNNLTNLYLYYVPLSGIEGQMLLRNCLNLEWLTLRHCTLPAKLCICDLSRLKYFSLKRCEGLQNLELSAFNLTTFEICNRASIEISFSCVPRLEKVFFSLFYQNAMPYIFGEVARGLPQLKSLSILSWVEWVENMPANPSVFSNVKQLELFMFQDRKYNLAKIIAPLLSALPLLQKLYIVMPFPLFYERRDEISVEEVPGCVHTQLKEIGCVHTQLKEIEIGAFYGTGNQIDFAICVLKNAVALERMVLDAWFKMYLGSGSWKKQSIPLLSKGRREYIRDLLLGNILSRKTEVIIR